MCAWKQHFMHARLTLTECDDLQENTKTSESECHVIQTRLSVEKKDKKRK